MSEPISVICDGDCAFRRQSLRALKRIDRHGAMRPYRSRKAALVAARFPIVASADFEDTMFAVTADGRVLGGYFAFKEVLRALPAGWPLLLLTALPGADIIGPRFYTWVARNRGLGCDSSGCDLPTSATRQVLSRTEEQELH